MMAVVCSELQEDYFLSSIATTLFTDMEEGEVTSEDNSCEYHIITGGVPMWKRLFLSLKHHDKYTE